MTDLSTETEGPLADSSGTSRSSIGGTAERATNAGPTAVLAGAVALYVVAAWWLIERGLSTWLSSNPDVNFYLVQPAIWTGLAAISWFGWVRLSDRPPFSRALTGIAALVGGFNVALLVLGGAVFGFGDSMVAGRLVNYPRNALFVATSVIGLEMARAFCFHAWRPYNERAAFFGTAGLLALAMTPYGQFSGLLDTSALVSILGGFIAPTLMLSVLLTWLADHGGPAPAIAFVAVLAAFEWFSQVQPELEWPALFVIGTAGPIISAKLIRDIYLYTEEGAARWADPDHRHEQTYERHPLAWTIAVTAAVLSVIGVASLLGFRPAAVTGISMEPTFEQGDLAILKRQVDPNSLSVGDVIEFNDRFDRPVVHRIISIERVDGTLMFTTQGDNNARPDAIITADQITARVVLLVPEMGHPALWFRSN